MTRTRIAGLTALLATALLAAALAGCASEPEPAPPAAAVVSPTAVPLVLDPAPLAIPPVSGAVAHDTCGANALAGVIGRPRTSIPIPVDLTRRRVVCTTCPISQEYRPDRLTILYDLRTGVVTGLRCG